ncbi:hypothetical protein T4B_6731 [Trichinella pseudospiralis]|uniref:Uncharacterized protein n=1 Tax=Trichinella pseudospiralis TaxID=6337 RepID=A0A0V1H0M4_TRIPS|nr:hypothetical protein T4B_6731 [Trichinella pseudospiralis]KRZ40466.1 hypothetical protein T4C_4993 [Trichinella pseudospiralis]
MEEGVPRNPWETRCHHRTVDGKRSHEVSETTNAQGLLIRLSRSLIHLRQHRFGDIHHRGGRRLRIPFH